MYVAPKVDAQYFRNEQTLLRFFANFSIFFNLLV